MKNSKKLAAVLLLLLYTFSCTVCPFADVIPGMTAYAEETITVLTVTGSVVNVRSGAGTGFGKLGTTYKGQSFAVLGSETNEDGELWYIIDFGGQKGYIISTYCTVAEQTVPSATSATGSAAPSGNIVVITGSIVNVRREASISSSRVATVKKGENYELIESVTDLGGVTWYKIIVNGVEGYISSAYGSVSTTATTIGDKTIYIVISGSVVNIRAGAGTSYSRVGTLRKGDKCVVLGSTKDSEGTIWYRVNVNGVAGYVSGKYAELNNPNTTASTTTTTTFTTVKPTTTTTTSPGTGSEVRTVKTGIVTLSSGTLNVRSSMSTSSSSNIIGKLANGTKVVILGSSTGWYKIEFKSASSGYGYVSSSYIKDVKTETTLVTLAFGTDYYYVNVGSSVKVSANASGYTVTYSSSNTSAAPVDASTGSVRGVTPGMYTITAKCGTLTATTQVVVLKAPYTGITPMKISAAGTEFIAQWEGGDSIDPVLGIVAFYPYKDEVGFWTIGYGFAYTSTESKSWSYERAFDEFNKDVVRLLGEEHKMTEDKPYLTQEEAYMLLNVDLNDGVYVAAINGWAMRNGVKLTQQQFDALVSFCYNLGPAYWTSDTYYFYLKSAILCQRSGDDADPAQVIEGFTRYMRAGSLYLKGLWWRRRNEAEMFIEGDYALDRGEKFPLPSNVNWS